MELPMEFKDIIEEYKEFPEGRPDSNFDQPQLTNHNQDYEEFDSWSVGANDASFNRFEIKIAPDMIWYLEEFALKEFHVPGLNEMRAQLKCEFNRQQFQCDIRFSEPTLTEKWVPDEFNPIITVILQHRDSYFDQKICFVFPFAQPLLFGYFYPVFQIPNDLYVNRLFNYNQNDMTLLATVRNGFLHDVFPNDEGRLRWKVDVSRFNFRKGMYFLNETQMAFSPFFSDKRGCLKVQLRLLVKGENVEAESRFFNNNSFPLVRRKFRVSLRVIHPHCRMERIDLAWVERASGTVKNAQRSVLTPIDDLIAFIFPDDKLRITVEINEVIAS